MVFFVYLRALRDFYVAGRCQAPSQRCSFSTRTLESSAAEAGPPPKSGAGVGGRRMSVDVPTARFLLTRVWV